MLKRIFWNGLKIFVPIVVTMAIVVWAFSTLETFFGKLLQMVLPGEYYFRGLGILVGLAVIFMVGLLFNAWIVRKIYEMAENLVKRIPLIKTLYNAVKDLMSYFDKNAQSSQQQAVLIQTSLGKVMGFITCDTLTKFPLEAKENEILVYIPLSYQIGGLSVMVPREAITILEWSANQAMSFILTAGMTGKNNLKK